MSEPKSVRGVSRIVKKLDGALEAQNYYEAHQIYRSIYYRYTAQKNYEELLEMLWKGVLYFIEFRQQTIVADLTSLIVDVLEKTTPRADHDEWIKKLGDILRDIGPIVEREALLTKIIKWSSSINTGGKLGHPMMHKILGQVMWFENNLEQAKHHFLLSKDGEELAQMLVQMSVRKAYRGEIDLIIAQAILQQLCLKEAPTAQKTFSTYTKLHPEISAEQPPFALPLLNFLAFLLKLAKSGKLESFKNLCDLYKRSTDRDPSYEKYLQKIGILYFGAPAPPARSNHGLFGDLVNQFFQGLEDEPSSSTNATSAVNDLD
ncbi:Golgi to ER traffic protein 4 homolog [Lutzomyia longipalpis]|uniref:Protein with signal anchor n=1 Tax=Lutzomyia longipalpis TaxID=7200 RepID=A0A1B0GH42_LUTLO|nr:Golgi to ER traffic protein 4 homolog [Lutzomyia longipalpis]